MSTTSAPRQSRFRRWAAFAVLGGILAGLRAFGAIAPLYLADGPAVEERAP
jgi:hypothetical protein